mgnify:CR=1 FL=1
MPRIGLFNIAFGFLVLFFAASAGVFLVVDVARFSVRDQTLLNSWAFLMQKSSHSHTNLFGIIHIVFGLSLPYSVFNAKMKFAQTIGLACGTMAMAAGMLMQSFAGPKENAFDTLGIMMGILLSLSLLALISHAAGVFAKLNQRLP